MLKTCISGILSLLFLATTGLGQEGSITPKMIQTFRDSLGKLRHGITVVNAVTKNEVRNLVLDRKKLTLHDSHYTNKIKTGKVTNQKSSGRCWLFAGFNIMRPVAMKKLKVKNIEFSQNYSFFWDKLEKANLFLEGILQTRDRGIDDRQVVYLLKHPFPDGGQWNMVVDLVVKYGVVPVEVMPETSHTGATRALNALAKRKLRRDAAILRDMHAKGQPLAALRGRKAEMLSEIYCLLAFHFGEPPATFKWRYENKDGKVSKLKSYTPKSFYKEIVGLDLTRYVCLYNCPAHPYGKLYNIQFDRDLFDRPDMTFINAEMKVLKSLTLKQLLDGESVWFGCDVGKDHFRDKGILKSNILDYEALLGMKFSLSKKDRILYQDSIPTHAMVFMGVDLEDGKPVKWRVENSWGAKRGDSGYLAMYDGWFDEYLYSVIINKKHVPQDVLKILDQKPIALPPWDPMFAMGR